MTNKIFDQKTANTGKTAPARTLNIKANGIPITGLLNGISLKKYFPHLFRFLFLDSSSFENFSSISF